MTDRHNAIPVAIAFVRAGKRLLLLRHAARKDRFAGLWNGVGGHVHAGEDIRAAAAREFEEETNLRVESLRLRGVIHESGLLGKAHLLFIFDGRVPEPLGLETPPTQRDGEFAWFLPEEIPWKALVPDLQVLLPKLLEDDKMIFGVQDFDGEDRPLRLRLA